jgi:oligoribonuclease (3'-5' exoribonuclease)
MQARLAIVDVETTGSDPATDRVTEIAVLRPRAARSGRNGARSSIRASRFPA